LDWGTTEHGIAHGLVLEPLLFVV